jgi:hypothetical protein
MIALPKLLLLGGFVIIGICSTSWAGSTGTYDYVSKVNIVPEPQPGGHILGFLYIDTPGNLINSDNCQDNVGGGAFGPSYAKTEFDLTNDLTRAQMQVALGSLLSRLPVFIYTEGCTPDGKGRLLLKQIQIQTSR